MIKMTVRVISTGTTKAATVARMMMRMILTMNDDDRNCHSHGNNLQLSTWERR